MPFKSSRQRKFLFAKMPEVAKKFAAHDASPIAKAFAGKNFKKRPKPNDNYRSK